MLEEIRQSFFQCVQVFIVQLCLCDAAMIFQRPDGRHDNDGAGPQSGHSAFDVHELLRPQIGGKTGLRDRIVAHFQCHAGGRDRITAMGNIGEGTAVDESRRTFQGLDQVGLQGILQKSRHGTFRLQIVGGNGLAVIGVSHDHTGQTGFQIDNIG